MSKMSPPDNGSDYGSELGVESDVEVVEKKSPGKSPKKSPSNATKQESPSKSRLVEASGGTLNTDSIPLIIKKGSWSKNVMLCEVEDPELSLVGDSGAVGRMTVTEEEFGVDLKGRQYSGKIIPTHTVCLLNLAAPGKHPYLFSHIISHSTVTLYANFCILLFLSLYL